MEPKNRFQGINSVSICSLKGWYDIPIPTRFLAYIDFSKIPARTPPPPHICTVLVYTVVVVLLGTGLWGSTNVLPRNILTGNF
jgi:hypothetical protein